MHMVMWEMQWVIEILHFDMISRVYKEVTDNKGKNILYARLDCYPHDNPIQKKLFWNNTLAPSHYPFLFNKQTFQRLYNMYDNSSFPISMGFLS